MTLILILLASGGEPDLWLDEPTESVDVPAVSGLRPESTLQMSGEDLLRRGYRTLGDALVDLVGINAQRSTRGPRYGMRGIPDGLVLIIDGVPHRVDGERDLLDVDEGLDLADVDRIEMIRGPASAINGAGALSGAVRVFTRRPGLTGGRLLIGATDLGKTDLGGEATWRDDTVAVRASALYRRGQSSVWRLRRVPVRYLQVGSATVPSTKINTDVDPDDDEAMVTRLALGMGELMVDASYGRTHEHTPLSSFSHALLDLGPQQRQLRERYRLRLVYGGRVGPARLSAAAFGARHVRVDRIMLFPPRDAYPHGGRVSVHGRVWTGGLWSRVDLPLSADRRLVLGGFGDISDQDAYSDAFAPRTGVKTARLAQLDETTGSLTGALEYQGDLGGGWHITAGAAATWHTGYAPAFVPRAAVVYVPTEWLSLRAAYAEGSRAPDRFDMVALTQAVVDERVVGARGNDDLTAEHARTAELGFVLEPWHRLRADVVAFVTRHEDAVESRADGQALVPANLEPRLIAGGEADADLAVVEGLINLRVGGALARLLDGPDLDTNLLAAQADATLTPQEWLTLGARVRLHWRERDRVGAGTHVILDSYASCRLHDDRLELRLALRNGLDARDPRPDVAASPAAANVALPGPGRTVFVSLEGRL